MKFPYGPCQKIGVNDEAINRAGVDWKRGEVAGSQMCLATMADGINLLEVSDDARRRNCRKSVK